MEKPSNDELRALVDAANGNRSEAGRRAGFNARTFTDWCNAAGILALNSKARHVRIEPAPNDVVLPEFPDDDIPVTEIIDSMIRRYEKREAFRKAKNWFKVAIRLKGPIGVSFWGDPHVDDDGCNWPLLHRHVELHRANPALFSVNIGDTTNNWIGRLIRLYAKQETSKKTADKLAKWFLSEAGLRWIAVILGNHDLWGDTPAIMRASTPHLIMEDWQARFVLAFPNGREVRVWAAHDFPGNSQWNPLHGPQKAAHTKSEADIYACGHKHHCAIHQEQSGSRDFTYWLIRSRGYKFIDEHSDQLGHFAQDEGASVTAIINPDAKSQGGLVQCFTDMEAAVDYLAFLRARQ